MMKDCGEWKTAFRRVHAQGDWPLVSQRALHNRAHPRFGRLVRMGWLHDEVWVLHVVQRA